MATIKRVSGDYAIESVNAGDSITLDTDTAIITGNLTVTGSASFANLSTDRIFSGTSNVVVSVPSGNITVGVAGTGNVVVFTNNALELAGNFTATGNVLATTASTTGNVTGGNLVTAGNIVLSRDASAGTPQVRFSDTDTTVSDGTVLGQLTWFTSDAVPGNRITSIIQSVASGTTGNANIQILTSTNGAAASVKVTVLSDGNVGIGNSAPAHLLAVQGTIYSASAVTAAGNVSAGNITTVGAVSATGNVTGGNVITGGQAVVTGNVTGGNVITTGAVSAGAGGISATGNVDGGNVRTSGIISSTGNVTATDYLGTTVSMSGNVTGGNIITAGDVIAQGILRGDLEGSVFADDSTLLVDAIDGNLFGNVISATGNITGNTLFDNKGEIRTLPENAQTTVYTLLTSDAGKYISSNANVVVPTSVFSSGQTVAIYNNSAASITVVQDTGVTMYNIGTATTGNRTLAQRGIATVFCVGANTFVIGGGGVS